VQQEQRVETLQKIDKQAEKIITNNSEVAIANSFKKLLETKDPKEVMQMTMQLNQIAIESLITNNSFLNEKVKNLEVEVGKSKEYYSIKKISIINNKKEKDYKWSLLKKESVKQGKEIKTERDNNYGNVNSYHINVWKYVYPSEIYS
jgi:hypothetical protein